MNKEELLKEIKKTEEHLATMKKLLEDCEYRQWRLNSHDPYYYIDSTGSINDTCFMPSSNDIKRFNNYNYFRTKKQADLEAEKILIRRQLEDIARRLNKGVKIDWHNQTQIKYGISYNTSTNVIETYFASFNKAMGSTYCLDVDFKDMAIKEIGQERLEKYLKGE